MSGRAAGAIEAEVEAIERALDATDPAARVEAAARLDGLRARWKESPAAFDAETVGRLKRLAAALSAPRPIDAAGRPTIEDARATLREVFGHAAFRPGQEAIVAAALGGRDCVGVMPTGAGKSLTYQLPARLLGGTTLVVSPLIALMKDQVDAMARAGLRATFLNSTLSPEERQARVRALRRGELELLYAAPEGLEASVGSVLEGVPLSLIAVDEAHCISQWGHDFRPAYRNLAGLRDRFGAPVLALTATATPAVTRDIAAQLGMVRPLLVKGSFLRRNLRLHAVKKGGDGPSAREAILRLVHARRGQSGIVYALSRRSVEEMAEYLAGHGVRATAYHAGLEAEERERIQDDFRAGRADVIVATVAFGMGIDKPDIRFVFHRDLPRSPEAYYQEVGRAGRDGRPADCVLFYSWADVMAWDRMSGDDAELAAAQRRQARAMFDFADGDGCRHQGICRHFGEAVERCGDACDACTGEDPLARLPPAPRARRSRREPPGRSGSRPGSAALTAEADLALFERLREWRAATAREAEVPAYVILSDATLAEIALSRPGTDEALLEVNGIGQRKLEAFGDAILRLVRKG
ncbi:MAG TPA: ATP-dependent DNA helicase RecQ [Anaeromyxobacteraceae bacterium]|nr:ATP-dependent DNA helicase RecQ [Anaeromyxobacteraceae bacterium]